MSQYLPNIDLASGWSHDIRTHLNIVKSAISMMESGKLTQEQTREYTGMIRQNVLAMERLINHLLNCGDSDEKMIPNPLHMQIDALLCRVVENVKPLAASRQIDLFYDISGPLHAFCDPEMLERVLYNLLTNAIKCTEASGIVYLSARKKDACVQINVADTGCGMSERQLAQLSDGVQKPVDSGHGLRLVKMMMAAMNGRIACSSHENLGTTFYLYIPEADCPNRALPKTGRRAATKNVAKFSSLSSNL